MSNVLLAETVNKVDSGITIIAIAISIIQSLEAAHLSIKGGF